MQLNIQFDASYLSRPGARFSWFYRKSSPGANSHFSHVCICLHSSFFSCFACPFFASSVVLFLTLPSLIRSLSSWEGVVTVYGSVRMVHVHTTYESFYLVLHHLTSYPTWNRSLHQFFVILNLDIWNSLFHHDAALNLCKTVINLFHECCSTRLFQISKLRMTKNWCNDLFYVGYDVRWCSTR